MPIMNRVYLCNYEVYFDNFGVIIKVIYAKFDADKVKQSKVTDVLVQINQVKWPFKYI